MIKRVGSKVLRGIEKCLATSLLCSLVCCTLTKSQVWISKPLINTHKFDGDEITLKQIRDDVNKYSGDVLRREEFLMMW